VTADAGMEIRAILASKRAGAVRSCVFGCSPPVRTGDPLVRDSGFRASSGCLASLGRPPSRASSSLTACAPPAARRVEGFFVKDDGRHALVH